MRKIINLAVTLVAFLGVTEAANADISIDQLIEQTGMSESEVAVRDLPRWHGANKILIRDNAAYLDQIIASAGDTEVVVYQSLPQALQR